MGATITLMCFPAGDKTFADLAYRALAGAVDRPAPDVIAAVLRPTYPHVVVRPQDPAAALGPGARWYLFRDGQLSSRPADQWWADDDLPRVVIDQTNRYTEANDAACALFEVAPGGLLGRSWEEFAGAATAQAAEALRQTLQRNGHGDSTFQLTRANGTTFDIDYHTVVYVSAERVLYETVFRARPNADETVSQSA